MVTRHDDRDTPDPPYFEVTAHPAGQEGVAAMRLVCHTSDQALAHARRWDQGETWDVLAWRVTADGRERIYPRDVADVAVDRVRGTG